MYCRLVRDYVRVLVHMIAASHAHLQNKDMFQYAYRRMTRMSKDLNAMNCIPFCLSTVYFKNFPLFTPNSKSRIPQPIEGDRREAFRKGVIFQLQHDRRNKFSSILRNQKHAFVTCTVMWRKVFRITRLFADTENEHKVL